MVEISLSGSGEGPGRVTSRPTLQRYFATVPSEMHPLGCPGSRSEASRPQDGWRYQAGLAWGDGPQPTASRSETLWHPLGETLGP